LGNVLLITLNRPSRKNAFSLLQYAEVASAFEFASKEEQIKVVVLTGAGDYYSSGNDLSQFLTMDISKPEQLRKMLDEAAVVLIRFVKAFIHFPKILIAAVNGPAIGIACTTLGHCDFVYGSESCTFHTPFVSLGQVPEACSSFTFPMKMGSLKANEMLLLGKKLDAQSLLRCNLLNDVYKGNELLPKVMENAKELAELPSEALLDSKGLIRNPELLKQLDRINNAEVQTLQKRWASQEFMEAIMNFMAKKSQSKL